jgi:hypothetical protein
VNKALAPVGPPLYMSLENFPNAIPFVSVVDLSVNRVYAVWPGPSSFFYFVDSSDEYMVWVGSGCTSECESCDPQTRLCVCDENHMGLSCESVDDDSDDDGGVLAAVLITVGVVVVCVALVIGGVYVYKKRKEDGPGSHFYDDY